MTHHNHDHKNHHTAQGKRPIHRDWRTWVAVGLALAAMLAYVLSNDESLQPAGDGPPMPAEAPAE